MAKNLVYHDFLKEIKERIRSAQYNALKAVNKEMILLYWDIGRMIVDRQKKHGWGKAIVENLAEDLQKEFLGMQGFSVQNLWYMRQFYMEYHKNTKLQPLVGEISWTKHLIIMAQCKDDLEREFYIRMTKRMGWTKNVLIHQIENKTYEKTLINQTNFNKNLPSSIKEQAKLAVKDEYTFDFLELGEEHSEMELAREVAKSFCVEPCVHHLPARKEVVHAFSSHEKVYRIFAHPASVSLTKGIEKMAQWAKEKGSMDPVEFQNDIEVSINLPPSWEKKTIPG